MSFTDNVKAKSRAERIEIVAKYVRDQFTMEIQNDLDVYAGKHIVKPNSRGGIV